MVDLNPMESLVLQAMKDLGATSDEKKKTADDIAKKTSRPKSMISNVLVELDRKGVIKRVVREKASGYYIISK